MEGARSSVRECEDEVMLPSLLARGQIERVQSVEAEKTTTRPPKRLTEASLLTAMETAGKTLDGQGPLPRDAGARARNACNARGDHRDASHPRADRAGRPISRGHYRKGSRSSTASTRT